MTTGNFLKLRTTEENRGLIWEYEEYFCEVQIISPRKKNIFDYQPYLYKEQFLEYK
jgi:hypothetical protein